MTDKVRRHLDERWRVVADMLHADDVEDSGSAVYNIIWLRDDGRVVVLMQDGMFLFESYADYMSSEAPREAILFNV